jgi:hypothetical protein
MLVFMHSHEHCQDVVPSPKIRADEVIEGMLEIENSLL